MYSRCKLVGLLTPRQIELLQTLRQLRGQMGATHFWKPKDLGSVRGSHHAKTLASLAEAQYVLQKSVQAGSREHYLYAISDEGLKALEQLARLSDVPVTKVPGRRQDQARASFLASLLKEPGWAQVSANLRSRQHHMATA